MSSPVGLCQENDMDFSFHILLTTFSLALYLPFLLISELKSYPFPFILVIHDPYTTSLSHLLLKMYCALGNLVKSAMIL